MLAEMMRHLQPHYFSVLVSFTSTSVIVFFALRCFVRLYGPSSRHSVVLKYSIDRHLMTILMPADLIMVATSAKVGAADTRAPRPWRGPTGEWLRVPLGSRSLFYLHDMVCVDGKRLFGREK